MRSFIHCSKLIVGVLFLFSCTKQIADKPVVQEIAGVANGGSMSKHVVMAVFTGSSGFETWKTVMQKWFDNNGRLAYLKAGLHFDEAGFSNLPLHLEWGEVTYHADQVYVKNVPRNDTIMRVTLGAQQHSPKL